MKIFKYILLILLGIFLLIQFIARPEKINEPITEDDIEFALNVNPEMMGFLKAACYDCHSNQPKYPWYASVAPISWSIADHIAHGRDEMNFSEWRTFSKRKADHKLEEMLEEVAEGHMPLSAYLSMHPEAEITPERLAMLKAWVLDERAKLAESE